MMNTISVEQFRDKIDSLYRLVILAARRATQVSKPDSRPLVPVQSKKSTIVALEEILQDKVTYRTTEGDEEDYVE
jgi:DNA-directed RNA polymerase omega subunit